VQANKGKDMLNIQGRFEQVPDNVYGEVFATQLTSIVGKLLIVQLFLKGRADCTRFRSWMGVIKTNYLPVLFKGRVHSVHQRNIEPVLYDILSKVWSMARTKSTSLLFSLRAQNLKQLILNFNYSSSR